MKIKAKNSSVAGTKLIVPVDGLIEIDKSGVADVSAKCATTLVKGTNDWEYLKAGKVEEVEEEEDDIEDLNDGSEDDVDERAELEAKLAEMKLGEMKTMAEEAGFPKEEWEGMTTKKLMSAYLLEKYDATSEEEEEDEE